MHVVIYEALEVAGGLLAWAIPPFRLPREALEEDVTYVLNHGVDLELNHPLGPNEVIRLKEEKKAVILACGAPQSQEADLPGTGLKNVWPGLDFLRRVSLGPPPELKDPILVIGGGNTAIDSARWALRLATDVTLLYRRDREQMPAYREEIDAAVAEGLRMVFRTQPVSIEADAEGGVGAVCWVETKPTRRGDDGREVFSPLVGTENRLPAKTVILALGQQSEAASWAAGLGLSGLTPDSSGLLAPGLYGVGDLITGPATVVEAIASGIACARAILAGIRP
jgi:NADPH-dependent glutamate synthase beta subunit-like oxidoreductase